jgi:hypothetical protein
MEKEIQTLIQEISHLDKVLLVLCRPVASRTDKNQNFEKEVEIKNIK